MPALFVLLLLQSAPCVGDEQAIARAQVRANALDVAGALAQLEGESLRNCNGAVMAAVYLRGLMTARLAYANGGDARSLQPVRNAIVGLDERAKTGSRSAEMASLVLRAAASAAQSEREEMAVFLEHALRTESAQLDAGLSATPVITAHEAAGDLWLQVHQYERAREAYRTAVKRVGARPRLTLGLARVAARLKEKGTACAEYQSLVERWHWPSKGPAEIDEARLFIKQECPARRGERRP